jgi:hypothetical protein
MNAPDPKPFDFSSSQATAPIRCAAQQAVASQARRGAFVLFLVGGLQFVFMFLFTTILVGETLRLRRLEQPVAPVDSAIPPLVYVSYAIGVGLAALFVGLGFWARRDPLLASIIGLACYLGASIFDLVLSFGYGLTLLPGGAWSLLLRAFIVVLLIDAIRAGAAYKRIVNRLIAEMCHGGEHERVMRA